MARSSERNPQRSAIWSVPEDTQTLFLILFSIQFIALSGLVIWHEINSYAGGPWPEVIIAIGQGIGPWILIIAAESIITAESYMWVSERYKQRRYLQGHEEGREEGRAEAYEEWEAWNRRREAAQTAGEPFNEPPPSLKRNGDTP